MSDFPLQIDAAIGPCFERELKEAGLIGLPIAWSSDYVLVSAEIPKDRLDSLRSIIQAHDPEAIPYAELRVNAYRDKELDGTMPTDVHQNIDELWKVFQYLELKGLDLPTKASSIIRERQAVKNKFPKE